MIAHLFKKDSRAVALVYANGSVEMFTSKTIENHPVKDFLESDLSIADAKGDVQIKEIDVYEGQLGDTFQTLYSISYNSDKRPHSDSRVPRSVHNALWNFLEGGSDKAVIKQTATVA